MSRRQPPVEPFFRVPRPTTSLVPPIFWGILLVLLLLTLTVFWNIALVTDWFRFQRVMAGGALWWGVLLGGYVLFFAVIVGLILFIISLAKQIRLNQRQQNFIDSVTHELKSPLTSLKLHLETMRLRELPPATRAEFTELMLADVERLNLLIDHVLEAARVDGRRRDFRFEGVPLWERIEGAIILTRRRHHLPEDAIDLQGEDMQVQTDPVALELVLLNLLENAVKYSRETVKVTVSTYRDKDGRVVIAIADDGVGIPRNQVKRIFQRFHRVGNEMTRIRQGTGLGLYIVKETLRSLNGSIRAESPGENQGSVFTLTLPGDARG